MIIRAAVLAAGLSALGAAGAAAQSIQCGTEYTVRRGDTLSQIATRAYDSTSGYQLIYSANAEKIGANPGVIEVGESYLIPCVDDLLEASLGEEVQAETAETGETAAATSAAEPLPPAARRQVRIVMGSDWAPYLDKSLDHGGLLAEIVDVAMSKVLAPQDYKLDVINDWSALLRPLLSDGAYDISLAWFRPDCDRAGRQSADTQYRCTALDWSEPLYEQVIGYYMRAGDTAPLTHTDLFGRTICRPEGFSTFMLEAHDLVEPNITMAAPTTAMGCMRALVAGEVDVVVLATDVADHAFSMLDVGNAVQRHGALDSLASLHAVTSKANPEAEAQLALLNEGLRQIKENGEWFSIVRRHMTRHRMMVSN